MGTANLPGPAARSFRTIRRLVLANVRSAGPARCSQVTQPDR